MKKGIVFVLLLHVISVFGVMRIVSIQPLNSTLTSAKVLRDGEILWSELINARGGVLVNGTYHPVELISIDIGAPTDAQMAQNTIDAIRAVANGTYGVVNAMLAPFSSSLTEVHAIEAEKHNILSCAAGAYIYQLCNNLVRKILCNYFALILGRILEAMPFMENSIYLN